MEISKNFPINLYLITAYHSWFHLLELFYYSLIYNLAAENVLLNPSKQAYIILNPSPATSHMAKNSITRFKKVGVSLMKPVPVTTAMSILALSSNWLKRSAFQLIDRAFVVATVL